MVKDLKVTKGTVVRTVLTIVVLINVVLKACGIQPVNIEEGTLTSVIESLVSIGVIAAGFWKNNSFTAAAKNADFILAKLRAFDTDEADPLFGKETEGEG